MPQGKGKSKKEKFLNPIIQNIGHIKALQQIIGEDYPIFSVVVFSERCEFKKLDITSQDILVVKRDVLARKLKKLLKDKPEAISSAQIEQIYEKLYPMTQVSEAEKAEHVEKINSKYKG